MWNIHTRCHTTILLMVSLLSIIPTTLAMTEKRKLELREMTKEMFSHGWNNYMQYAYPEDELNPFECTGRGSDKVNPDNINVNDVLGDYSLTLVDSLDTIAIMGTQAEFEDAVERVIEVVSFHQDNKVQIFELNIRALGGLLSAHVFATEPELNRTIQGYHGELLEMAVNLADRLLPAFKSTKTGIPYPRVNLKKGVPPTETTETCTAGAGSLILEFGVLSRLTGNPEYERVAKRALKSIWSRRSQINLLGNVIDIQTGQWIHTASSTGAGIDSVFEYMLKAYILFGEVDYLNMFDEAYKALMTHVRDSSGYLYRNVHMSTGSLMSTWIDSLSAFFPGLQVLYGDLDSAIRNHLVFYNIWRRYHAIPERFDFYQRGVDLPFYPLRPEFIESTYHLYTATKDPFYLQVGEMVIEDLNNRTRIPCGFASIGDVQTGRLEDRMESFMLSETIKYLYLLFNEDSHINKMDSNYVFTTEGHILPLPKRYLRSPGRSDKKPSIKENHGTCQKYQPLNHVYKQNRRGNNIHLPVKIDTSSIPYQPQSDYASEIVGYTGSETPPVTNHGFCEVPTVATKSFALTFGYPNINKYFDSHVKYTTSNLIELIGGYLAKSVSGLRLEVVNKGGNGYIMKGVYPNTSMMTDILPTIMESISPFLSQPDFFNLHVRPLTTFRRMNSEYEMAIQMSSLEHHLCWEYVMHLKV